MQMWGHPHTSQVTNGEGKCFKHEGKCFKHEYFGHRNDLRFFRTFKEMVKDIERHLVGVLEDKTFIWVDMFAGNLHHIHHTFVLELTNPNSTVNQHSFNEDLKNLKEAIEQSPGGTLVVLSTEGVPLTRIW